MDTVTDDDCDCGCGCDCGGGEVVPWGLGLEGLPDTTGLTTPVFMSIL